MFFTTRVIISGVLFLSNALAQSADSPCNKDGDRIASPAICEEYLECQEGKYVSRKCGFWQKFDIIKHECRWSPLAACRKSHQEDTGTFNSEAPKHYCNYTEEPCTHSVPVISDCAWYCYCYSNGKYSDPLSCRSKTYFSTSWYTCVDNASVCNNTPTDPTVGSTCLTVRDKMRNSNDTKKYYECGMSKTWSVQQCALGQYFDADSSECSTNITLFMTGILIPSSLFIAILSMKLKTTTSSCCSCSHCNCNFTVCCMVLESEV